MTGSTRARRRLIYFPIIHSEADLGSLREPVYRRKTQLAGKEKTDRSAGSVEQMWREIRAMFDSLDLDYPKLRIYQDGLPVCGREAEIVMELAGAGSPNHELLRNLIEKGATVMGTESPDLLVEEYQLIMHSQPGPRLQAGAGKKAVLGRSLLEKRDKYIADRINRTLGPGEVGVIFIGMLHSVQKYLAPDIEVVHPANWSF